MNSLDVEEGLVDMMIKQYRDGAADHLAPIAVDEMLADMLDFIDEETISLAVAENWCLWGKESFNKVLYTTLVNALDKEKVDEYVERVIIPRQGLLVASGA